MYRHDFESIYAGHTNGPHAPESRSFIERIASALYERVDELPSLESWPEPVRQFYVLYDFNFQVGNGGFAQAAYNVPELFPIAVDAFESLGLGKAAATCRRALDLLPDEISEQIEKGGIHSESIEEVFEHFNESEMNQLDENIPEQLWVEQQLHELARANREAFLALDTMR